MTTYPFVATDDMTLKSAMRLMKEFHIRHLPVIDEGKIIGVVSERDLLRLESNFDFTGATVGEVMVRNPYVARVGTPLEEVTDVMAAHKFGCAVVVNSQEEVLGIFTTTDALKILTSILKEERFDGEYERVIEDYFVWDASMGE